MPETYTLRVLLLCDIDYNSQPFLQSVLQSPQSISVNRIPISDDLENCPINDADVVIVDVFGLTKHAIEPAELGDILYAHVPSVLIGQPEYSVQAMDGIRAGAQYWLVHDCLDERPLFDCLEQARRDFRQQRDLVVSHAKYRSVLEDQSEFICRFLPDDFYTLTFVNQAYAHYLGKNVSELENQSLLQFVLNQNQQEFKAKISSLTPEFPDITYDCRTVVYDDVSWMQWTNKAIFDSNGHMLEVQSVGVDVTVRRCNEQEALDNESRFRSFFQDLPVMMHELDESGRIINVNRCWSETMGYAADAVIDTHFFSYFGGSSRQQTESAFATLISQRWIKDVTCSLIKRNGDACDVLLSATAEFDADDNIQRSLVISVEVPSALKETVQARYAPQSTPAAG